VGVLGLLLPASAIVAFLARQFVDQPSPEPYTVDNAEAVPETSGDVGVSMTTEGAGAANQTATPSTTPTDTASGAIDTLWSLDPAIAAGVAFFLGGLLVFGVMLLWSR
jgi:hypothetical protein